MAEYKTKTRCGGAAAEKQVCAMNYTCGKMSHTSDERLSELFLFSQKRTLCTAAGQSISQSYRGQHLVNGHQLGR